MKPKTMKHVIILVLLLTAPLAVSASGSREADTAPVYHAMVSIQGGTFFMGSPEDEMWREPDETLHEVTVKGFSISRYEVTQDEYMEVTGENPSQFQGQGLPVENVSWYEAVSYCNSLSEREGLQPAYRIDGKQVTWDEEADGYRLPTEAEWEYACRAGTTTPFSTGRNIAVDEANYFGTYPYTIEDHYFSQQDMETAPGVYRERTVPVGEFEPNGWGLYDMHGNVSEWCYDRYGTYPAETQADPSGPAVGSLRICRGGGWNDFGKHLRSAFRSAIPSTDRFPSRGFRVARSSN